MTSGRAALEIGAQIVAEEIDGAITVLITCSEWCGVISNPVDPDQTLTSAVLEFADINIERCGPRK